MFVIEQECKKSLKFDMSVSAKNENDCLLPSGILRKHHSLYRVAFSSAAGLKHRLHDSVCQSSGVLMICNSQALYGCEYYVHST